MADRRNQHRTRGVGLLVLALIGLACADTAPAAEPPAWELAFVSSRLEGTSSVWLVDEHGEGLRQLAEGIQSPNDLAWSPDGSVLYFMATESGNRDIYSYDMETGEVVQLTDDPGIDRYPEMSPDGSQIIFISKRETGHEQVWVMDPDGSNQRRLTDIPGWKVRPTYSPDGQWIALQADNPTKQIWLMRPDGSELHNVSDNTHGDRYPTWNADGSEIIFTSVRDDVVGGDPRGVRHLYRMNADGSEQRPFVQWETHSRHADWSPDGRLVAFDGALSGSPQIYVVDESGDNLRRLTDEGTNHKPVFRPRPNE